MDRGVRSIKACTSTMAVVQDAPDFTGNLTLYSANDAYLSTILVYHGPVTSSRIQLIIFSLAGHQSFPRITLSPTSPLYAAVNHLPREKQGDEVCRGLAVGLLKYFAELPDNVKSCLSARAKKLRGKIPRMFDEMHAAEIADRMDKVENQNEVTAQLQRLYVERRIQWLDMDVLLPRSSIRVTDNREDIEHGLLQADPADMTFGDFDPLVRVFGEPVFLPTSKLQREPSKPTNLSKSRQFSRQQKEALRLAMCEVVDTEARYVASIYELVHSVAQDFRARARSKPPTSTSPSEDALSKLFPSCLDQILEVSLGFLDAIKEVLESTEQEAMEDITTTSETSVDSRKRRDPLGALAMGKVLTEWFPKFAQPYRDYLQLQSGFVKVLNLFMKDRASTFSQRVQQTGEQRLRSMLMEPVQRLPRYSLLIDAMTSALPSSHIALRRLLKARDMITEICSLDSPEDDLEQSFNRLQGFVTNWPKSLASTGRLIAALDAVQIGPGHTTLPSSSYNTHVIVLLFTDQLLFLGKQSECQLSATGLQLEVNQRSRTSTGHSSVPENGKLLFLDSVRLESIQSSQSTCGNTLYLTYPEFASLHHTVCPARNVLRAFRLLGPYQGKTQRFLEETTKAKIEHRFSETERESGKWVLLAAPSSSNSLNLLAAICEDGSFSESRRGHPSLVLSLSGSKSSGPALSEPGSSQILMWASVTTGGRYKIEMQHCCGKSSDVVSLEDVRTLMLKRLSAHLKMIHSVQNQSVTEALVESNGDVHRALDVQFASEAKTSRGFRPASPTKLLSSWWYGSQPINTSKADNNTKLKDIPSIPPPSPKKSESSSLVQKEDSQRIIAVAAADGSTIKDPLNHLEQTLTSYILALRSRRGNIVGRSLRGRAQADPVAVNDLYNILLEEASRIQAAAEVSVDVLIAAFENFLTHAWQEKFGPVLSANDLPVLQGNFERHLPADFERFFKDFLTRMAPQNKRAFTTMVRLLTDLLDASGNDADRGALTATFAELLTKSPNALQYMSLLDRLVEDYEKLFDDNVPVGWPNEKYAESSAEVANDNSYKTKSGSVSSQTSSFRKRFGFGLSRHNSKDEPESKVSSIIRNLAKTKGSSEANSQPSSLSKTALLRSKSTDSDSRIAPFLRPISRDKSSFSTLTFDEHAHSSRPGSAHSTIQILQSIGENPAKSETMLSKKKRRSSLSDLKSLQNTMRETHITPLPLRNVALMNNVHGPIAEVPVSKVDSSVEGPTPIKPLPTPAPAPALTPTPAFTPAPAPASAPALTPAPALAPAPAPAPAAISAVSPEKLLKTSAPPVVSRYGSTRVGSPTRTSPRKENIRSPTPQTKSSSPVKSPTPKITSPRLANLASPRSHLAERSLNRLTDDRTSPSKRRLDAPSNIPTPRNGAARDRPSTGGSTASTSPTKRPVAAKTSTASDRKLRGLDQLYKEVTMENQALYERFNKELVRMSKAAKRGDLQDELRKKVEEMGKEIEGLKRENLELRREIALKGNAAG